MVGWVPVSGVGFVDVGMGTSGWCRGCRCRGTCRWCRFCRCGGVPLGGVGFIDVGGTSGWCRVCRCRVGTCRWWGGYL